jgi:large subunit ribosomal protein L5
MTPHLQERYESQVKEALQKQFGYANRMQLPSCRRSWSTWAWAMRAKIRNSSTLPPADLATITWPEASHSHGQEVDCELQTARRYAHRLHGHPARRAHVGIHVSLDSRGSAPYPRLSGIPDRSFDGRGNYTFGVREQLIFRKSTPIKSPRRAAWTSPS